MPKSKSQWILEFSFIDYYGPGVKKEETWCRCFQNRRLIVASGDGCGQDSRSGCRGVSLSRYSSYTWGYCSVSAVLSAERRPIHRSQSRPTTDPTDRVDSLGWKQRMRHRLFRYPQKKSITMNDFKILFFTLQNNILICTVYQKDYEWIIKTTLLPPVR